MYSESNHGIENEIPDESDSDDRSSDDDDFYEDDDENSSRKLTRRQRPSTARDIGKVSKKIKPSSKSQKTIKNLRQMQLKNKQHTNQNSSSLNQNEDNLIKTAVNKVNTDREMRKITTSSNTAVDSADEDEAIHSADDEEDAEEKPFALNRRDIETVKVNQPRQPLVEKQSDALRSKTTASSQEPPKVKKISEKEVRISEMVRAIKDKQIKSERRKQFLETYRPWLICGGVLIGGIILQQIYKRFFY